jgi:hypothetical protein
VEKQNSHDNNSNGGEGPIVTGILPWRAMMPKYSFGGFFGVVANKHTNALQKRGGRGRHFVFNDLIFFLFFF